MGKQQNFRVGLDETLMIGEDTYFTSTSEGNAFGVAFEDDTEAGCFYAFSFEGDGVILDALHIYNVKDVFLKEKPCRLKVLWTEDGMIASLLINDYCHAIFDFSVHAGYCRNAYPENVGVWKQAQSRKLTDELILALFK